MKKHGKLPVNARISIDYRDKKPKIKFQYPDKQVVRQNLPLIYVSVMAFLTLVYLIAGFIISHFYSSPYPDYCNITQNRDENNLISNISLNCNGFENKTIMLGEQFSGGNRILYYFFREIGLNSDFYIKDSGISLSHELIAFFLLILFLLSYFFVLPYPIALIITKVLVKQEWYQKIIPKINKTIGGRANVARFTEVPNKQYIEIPLFRNVSLDYEAHGEFSKYLEYFEIKEHPFNSYLIKSNGTKKKKRKNIQLWYARFYFKENPSFGYLEVRFK